MNKLLCLICVLILCGICYNNVSAQEKNQTIEDLIEEIASNSDEELDYTSLYEDLQFFLINPLNLNEATEDDLLKLQFLNDFQIKSILKYREKYGDFLTIYEMQLLNGFSMDEVAKLLPFVTVGEFVKQDNFTLKRAIKYGSHQLFLRGQRVLEEQKGFSAIDDSSLSASPNSRYLGSPEKLYTRYKYHYKNKIYWGFTAEKDAGEQFLKGEYPDTVHEMAGDKLNSGFDYYSFHVQLNDIGPVKTIAVGDYQLQFGQGLTMWSGMSYGKSPYVLNIKKKPQGVRRYSSAEENLFMRGIGTTLDYKNFQLSGFVSKRKVDANVNLLDVEDDEIRIVSSLQTTGLHATPGALADKDAIDVSLAGGNITFNSKYIKLGATGVYYEYGDTIRKTPNMYNQFDYTGKDNFNVGLDYQFLFKGINFFGEYSVSKSGGMAYVNGALLTLAPQVAVSVLHRNYDIDYHSPYGNGFSESKTQNESGLYLGTIVYPIKKWKISAYYDMYKFPWMKSRVYAPSHGTDYFIQADYKPSRYVEMYTRFKREIKQQNATSENQSPRDLEDVDLMKVRFHISYRISRSLQLKNRVEFVQYQAGTENPELGYMIYQDIVYKPERIPLSVAIRYAVFDAPYNARIYAYENDILYAFSIPAYSNTGTRTYITLKYSVSKNLDIWLRYGQFYYKGANSITTINNGDIIGSGLTEIQGNKKSEVKLQLRLKF